MDNCIFCKLAQGEIPVVTAYEDDEFRVIFDAAPATRGHALILPKTHYKDLTAIPADLAGRGFALAGRIGKAQIKALGAAGFNVVQNNGKAAGQTVFHFHIHVIPRYADGEDIVAWAQHDTPASDELSAMARDLASAMEKT